MSNHTQANTIELQLPPKLKSQLKRYAETQNQSVQDAAHTLLRDALLVQRHRRVLARFRQGQLTIRQVAERLGLSYLETDALLAREGLLGFDLDD